MTDYYLQVHVYTSTPQAAFKQQILHKCQSNYMGSNKITNL